MLSENFRPCFRGNASDGIDLDHRRVTKAIIASGGSATFIRLDVTSVDAWHKALASAKEIYGRLDVLVNNAGWTYTVQDSHNVTEQLYDRLSPIKKRSCPLL